MARDWMQYDRTVQSALKGVVRGILRRVQAQGLPGDHHLYIVFRTTHPGVVIPGFLKERYPDEMTIVLQHQFWGLEVLEDKFRIGLSFNKSPQELTVPFAAMKGFFDPSVQFGLQFDIEDLEAAAENNGANPIRLPVDARAITDERTRQLEADQSGGSADSAAPGDTGQGQTGEAGAEPAKEPAKGEVVSLDAFRKK